MFETSLILIGVIVLAFFVLLISFLKRYQRCPSDKVLVIYGKVGKGADGEARSAKCIHGGAAFVLPILQDSQFLDLTPFPLNIDLRNALSRQNIRINVLSSFTVGISTEPQVMQNAAERLLGEDLRYVMNLAQDIITGQLRLIIATMDIEALNTQRDAFMSAVSENVEKELKKIGLKLFNANLTDIRDESGYIDALGKEAEAKAINDAKKTVAEMNRQGNTGEKDQLALQAIEIAKKDREQREGVAKENAAAIAAEKEAEKLQRTAIAQANAEAIAAEKEAEKRQREAVAQANASAIAAEKQAEALQRAALAESNANAVAAENQQAANIALSEAKRRELEAQASASAFAAEKVQRAKALEASYAAEKAAEAARAERQKATMEADVLVQAEIEKRKIELAAEAEAEAVRRKAKGAADALLMKMQAEADGYKAQLQRRAEGYAMLVNAANGDPNSAIRMMMTDKVDDLVKTQAEAIKNIAIDKITVWDTGSTKEGESTTGNFLHSLMKSVPPMKDVFDMVGVEVPGVKSAEVPAKAEIKDTKFPSKPAVKQTPKLNLDSL